MLVGEIIACVDKKKKNWKSSYKCRTEIGKLGRIFWLHSLLWGTRGHGNWIIPNISFNQHNSCAAGHTPNIYT